MAKKKKSSLKPVSRGFATTSTPKRASTPEPVIEEEEAVVLVEAGQIGQDPNNPANAELNGGSSAPIGTSGEAEKQQDGPPPEDWEDESNMLEEGIYQGYVERLQEKGEKEVNKILKVSDENAYLFFFPPSSF